MKYRDLIKLIEAAGCVRIRQSGTSHIVFRNPAGGIVVIASGGKLNRDVPKGTEQAIRRQAGLK